MTARSASDFSQNQHFAAMWFIRPSDTNHPFMRSVRYQTNDFLEISALQMNLRSYVSMSQVVIVSIGCTADDEQRQSYDDCLEDDFHNSGGRARGSRSLAVAVLG